MKTRKLLALIMTIALALSLCACSSAASSTSPAESQVVESESQPTAQVEVPAATAAPEATPAPTEAAERKGDFRSGNWGDSKEEVGKYEKGTLVDDSDGEVIYRCTVAGLDMAAVYCYDNEGKLYSGRYVSQEEHSNPQQHIADYNKLKDSLSSVYGTPDTDEVIPTNSAYESTNLDDGTALTYGWLGYQATWHTDNTDILMVMYGDNFNVVLGIKYTDRNHEEVYDNSGL